MLEMKSSVNFYKCLENITNRLVQEGNTKDRRQVWGNTAFRHQLNKQQQQKWLQNLRTNQETKSEKSWVEEAEVKKLKPGAGEVSQHLSKCTGF